MVEGKVYKALELTGHNWEYSIRKNRENSISPVPWGTKVIIGRWKVYTQVDTGSWEVETVVCSELTRQQVPPASTQLRSTSYPVHNKNFSRIFSEEISIF